MPYIKYTKELLAANSKNVYSFAALARAIGIKPTGSNLTNLRRRCEAHSVDVSHFTSQAHQKHKPAFNRKTAADILILNEDKLSYRTGAHLLRRAMDEVGIERKCVECGVGEIYNNKPLVLQVDHKNGVFRDNRQENLQYLCPNCHTQTDTWGVNNKA